LQSQLIKTKNVSLPAPEEKTALPKCLTLLDGGWTQVAAFVVFYIGLDRALERDPACVRLFHHSRFPFCLVPRARTRAHAHGASILEQAADPFGALAAAVVDVSF
jgi:hypothetical protein